MFSHRTHLLVVVFAAFAGPASAQLPDDAIDTLGKSLEVAKSFEPGQDAAPLVEIEKLVFTLPADSTLRQPVERLLIEALQSATTIDGKRFLCRQLRVMGTAECVSALEPLLTDPALAHMAVYALGRLEAPEAATALHRALSKATGLARVEIMNALADRRFQPAGPDFARLISSREPHIAAAAARALGRLGNVHAAEFLKLARADASADIQLAIDNGLLDCAAGMVTGGDAQQASAIYKSFLSSPRPAQFRLAALRGLVQTQPQQAAHLLANTIRGDDPAVARGAIALVGSVPGHEPTKLFAGLVPSLSSVNQALLIRALGGRGDTSASQALISASKSPEADVRLAAIEALGGAGDASAIPTLLAAAVEEGELQQAARTSLVRLPGKGVDSALLQLLDVSDGRTLVELIRTVSRRRLTQAVGTLLAAAKNSDSQVRSAAFEALGSLAIQSELRALVTLDLRPASAADRPQIEAAIGQVFSRIDNKRHRDAPIFEAWRTASAESKPTLLRLFGRAGSPEGLQVVRACLKETNPAIRDAAASTLAEWPDPSASRDLLQLIGTTRSQEMKELALRGYIRMAESSDDPTTMLSQALARVKQVNERKLVLASLGTSADSTDALQLLLKHLDDPDLAPTAGLAALRIAHRIRNTHQKQARQALQQVVDSVDHEDVRKRALEVINDMDKYADHILDWVGVGPFTVKGKTGETVYNTVFDPEKPDAKGVKWQPIAKGIGSWDINLEATFGGFDHCAAYCRTRVWSAVDREARLEMGSDDGIKAWVNGEKVFDQWAIHGASPRQHRATVQLKKGWNELLVKVVDHEGGWVFGCRLRAADGTALSDLKVQAQ